MLYLRNSILPALSPAKLAAMMATGPKTQAFHTILLQDCCNDAVVFNISILFDFHNL